jgi:hypothetical protein
MALPYSKGRRLEASNAMVLRDAEDEIAESLSRIRLECFRKILPLCEGGFWVSLYRKQLLSLSGIACQVPFPGQKAETDDFAESIENSPLEILPIDSGIALETHQVRFSGISSGMPGCASGLNC